MDMLVVERIGGLASFGGSGSRLRSMGKVDMSVLHAADREAVEALFASRRRFTAGSLRDGFRFRISRTTPTGVESVEAPENQVPAVLCQCVRDEIA
jgi:hypothetical protein